MSRPERWSVTLYDGQSRPARILKVKVLGETAEQARKVAESFHPGFEATSHEHLGWKAAVL